MTVLSVVVITFLIFIKCSLINSYECGPLYLSVSAYSSKLTLNWDFDCDPPPDTITLTTGSNDILEELKVDSRQGYHKTHHIFNNNGGFPGNWSRNDNNQIPGPQCFDYYIVSLKNNNVVDKQCLKIEPTWMQNFGDLALAEMMIPGTHDSGAFVTKSITKFFKRYVLTQKRDIWSQLVSGIRYLDLRIGYHGDRFYIYHGFARCAKLEPELWSILSFLEKSPKEVVILDFHEFPHPDHFSDEMHKGLQRIVHDILGRYIYVNPRDVYARKLSLKEMWYFDKRIIINYNDRKQVAENRWLWDGLRRDWGDVQKPNELEGYIKAISRRPRDGLIHVLCAELTLTTSYVFSDLTASLKKLADQVNPNLSPLLRENHRSDRLSVVATDFYMGNDVVNIALETNVRKLRYRNNFYF